MQRATEKPETTLLTIEYQVFRSQRWNCRIHDDTITSQNLSKCLKNIGMRNNSLKIWVKSRRPTDSAMNHNNFSSTWTTQREIFGLCGVSVKLQCPDYNAFSEIGIIYGSSGKNLKYLRSPTTTQKTNNDYSSIPDSVILKNSSRGPKHGQSERQIMFFKTKEMLKKARQEKHGSHPTILSRWHDHEEYESHWRSTRLTKRKSYFSIVSLLLDTTIQLRELSGCRTPNIGFFVWMLMGLKSLFDSDQNLPTH